MVAPALGAADPGGDEQIVLSHQPQHPTAGGPDALHAQPRPNLAVPLAMERTGGKDGADRLQ